MKKINESEMEDVSGGILPPDPGDAERCRAMAIAAYVQEFGGLGQNGLSPQDFICFF